jgi:hypothetical protein
MVLITFFSMMIFLAPTTLKDNKKHDIIHFNSLKPITKVDNVFFKNKIFYDKVPLRLSKNIQN